MSTIWTLSPTSTLISGAGTTPLYVHALTITPGSTSQSVIAAVSSKRFVPSGRISGASFWPPTSPLMVGSRNAIARSVIAVSISCHEA